MDPLPQHNNPPDIQAPEPQTGPLSTQEPRQQLTAPQSTISTPPSGRPGISNTLVILGIALLSIGLLAFATWSYISKQNDSVGLVDPALSGRADLPRDTVALINSSTPIPLNLLPNVESSAGNLDLPPISDSWTPALREANRAEIEGRYSSAISQYSALVGVNTPGEAREALWGLASSYAVSGQRELAIRAYSIFAGLNDPRATVAFVRAGVLYEELGDTLDAARIYGEYAKLGGPAANAVKLTQARLLGSTPDAEKLYNEVIDANPLDPDLRQALASLADIKSKRGDHAGARLLYERLATLQTRNPRPILDSQGPPPQALAANEAEAAGDKPGAVKSLLAYISQPSSYPDGRYSALTTLLKLEPTAVASGTVAPMLAAQIAFDAGYYGEAITFMDIIRTATPDSPDRPAAALLTGRAFDLLGDATSAYNWYTATLQLYPTSPQAPGAIRRAADALAEQSQWDASLGTYEQAVTAYPNAGDELVLTRIRGAVLAYRLEDRDTALSLITPLISAEISPTLKSQALFWAAKIQKSASNSAWRDTISPISTLSPGSYFDFRARSLLSGEPGSGPIIPRFTFTQAPISSTSLITLTVDYASEAQERDTLLAWASALTPSLTLTITPTSTTHATFATPITPTPTATSTSDSTVTQNRALERIEGLLHNSPEASRAAALLDLGFESEARPAFLAVASQLHEAGDASGLAALVIYLRYHAAPYISMPVAALLSSMDRGDPTKQPLLLLKTLYPAPYSDLVMDQARQRNIDPLLFFALMKQESQFISNAHSSADARGLSQIVPSTGQGIADQLGDASYSLDDLYLPYINIRYGTYYLTSNMPQFDSELLPVLAAYNAGPGNAARWLQGSALLDPDLFSERIDLFETYNYLQVIYRNYGFYQLIYSR